jgi:DnaK suppressor protein
MTAKRAAKKKVTSKKKKRTTAVRTARKKAKSTTKRGKASPSKRSKTAKKKTAKKAVAKAKTSKKTGATKPKVAEKKAAAKKKPRKSRLDLKRFRRMLREKQSELLQAYLSAKGHSRAQESDGTEDYIDYAVSSYSREFLLSLSELERTQLSLVEEALERMKAGGFGLCVQCERIIPVKRIEVQPWARYCLRCQELADSGLIGEFDDDDEDSDGDSLELDDDGDGDADEERLIGG